MIVLARGPYEGRISLGVYLGPQIAEHRQRSLAERGIDTELRARSRTHKAFRLDVTLPSESTRSLDEMLSQLAPDIDNATVDCFGLAAIIREP